jgi:hypothetical protein
MNVHSHRKKGRNNPKAAFSWCVSCWVVVTVVLFVRRRTRQRCGWFDASWIDTLHAGLMPREADLSEVQCRPYSDLVQKIPPPTTDGPIQT